MPLDPQARSVLERMNLLSAAIDPAQMSPELMRLGFEAMATEGAREAVSAIEDRAIPGPERPIPVRVYSPARDARLPAVVYFHGGGWVAGSLATHDGICRKLCNAAHCTVVSVDYRLAPEAKFPAAAEDAYAALAWVAGQGEEIGVDTARLAVAGDSAGGNLAAVAAQLARDRGGPALRFQLLIYPVIDRGFETASYRENANAVLLSRDMMMWFWDLYLSDPAQALDPRAAPIRAGDLGGLAPALIITAELDPLRDEGEAYAARLREAGVPTVCARYDGMFHGFFPMADEIDQAKHALARAARALRESFES